MSDERFALQPHLEHLYADTPRRLAYRAETLDEHRLWKQELRKELLRLYGLAGRQRPGVSAETVAETDRGDYVEQKVALDVGERVQAPAYVLVPKKEGPFKPVLVFHGHNPSVQTILGNYADDEDPAEMARMQRDYARSAVRAGYLVCAVEQRGFGERLTGNQKGGPFPRSCRHLSFSYMMQGRCLIGERMWDGMCALDYLATRDDVVPGAVAATGNSGGGTTTLHLSAVEERITCSVPSCYFCSFKASIMDLYHCECNYVPGIVEVAEMGELAALIAPRPLRIIAGEQDEIFPIAGVREQFETARRAYRLLGAEDRLSLAVHPRGHGYDQGLAREWFDAWL